MKKNTKKNLTLLLSANLLLIGYTAPVVFAEGEIHNTNHEFTVDTTITTSGMAIQIGSGYIVSVQDGTNAKVNIISTNTNPGSDLTTRGIYALSGGLVNLKQVSITGNFSCL